MNVSVAPASSPFRSLEGANQRSLRAENETAGYGTRKNGGKGKKQEKKAGKKTAAPRKRKAKETVPGTKDEDEEMEDFLLADSGGSDVEMEELDKENIPPQSPIAKRRRSGPASYADLTPAQADKLQEKEQDVKGGLPR